MHGVIAFIKRHLKIMAISAVIIAGFIYEFFNRNRPIIESGLPEIDKLKTWAIKDANEDNKAAEASIQAAINVSEASDTNAKEEAKKASKMSDEDFIKYVNRGLDDE